MNKLMVKLFSFFVLISIISCSIKTCVGIQIGGSKMLS